MKNEGLYQEQLVISMKEYLKIKKEIIKFQYLIWRYIITRDMIYYLRLKTKNDVWRVYQRFKHLLVAKMS